MRDKQKTEVTLVTNMNGFHQEITQEEFEKGTFADISDRKFIKEIKKHNAEKYGVPGTKEYYENVMQACEHEYLHNEPAEMKAKAPGRKPIGRKKKRKAQRQARIKNR